MLFVLLEWIALDLLHNGLSFITDPQLPALNRQQNVYHLGLGSFYTDSFYSSSSKRLSMFKSIILSLHLQ